jgi:hypothetical protein
MLDYYNAQAYGWPLKLEEIEQMTCSSFRQGLSEDERVRYLQGKPLLYECANLQ